MVLEFDGVSDTLCAGVGGNNGVEPLMFHCWPDKVRIIGMMPESISCWWLRVCKAFCSGWGHGRRFEMVVSVKGCMGRKCLVLATRAHKIQGEVRLGDEPAPVGDGEIGGKACEACDKVVFPSSDATFRRILAMHFGRCKLHINFSAADEFLYFR